MVWARMLAFIPWRRKNIWRFWIKKKNNKLDLVVVLKNRLRGTNGKVRQQQTVVYNKPDTDNGGLDYRESSETDDKSSQSIQNF